MQTVVLLGACFVPILCEDKLHDVFEMRDTWVMKPLTYCFDDSTSTTGTAFNRCLERRSNTCRRVSSGRTGRKGPHRNDLAIAPTYKIKAHAHISWQFLDLLEDQSLCMTNEDFTVTFKKKKIRNPQYFMIAGFHLPMLGFNLVQKSFLQKICDSRLLRAIFTLQPRAMTMKLCGALKLTQRPYHVK